MFCTQCGKPNPETAKFCQLCGATIGGASAAKSESPSPTTRGAALADPLPAAPKQQWCITLLWWKGWASSPTEYRGLTELQKFDFWSCIGYSTVSALMWLLFFAAGAFSTVSPESNRFESIGQSMFAYVFLQLGLYLYLLPTVISVRRQRPNRMAIFALDFLLGWTLVGWAVALSWALASSEPTG